MFEKLSRIVSREKVAELLAQGMRNTDIANELECTPKTISVIKRELKGLAPGLVGRPKELDYERARKLIQEGLPNIVVAERLGVRPNTIPDLKRKLGFDVNGFRKGTDRRAEEAKHRSTGRTAFPSLKQGAHPASLAGSAEKDARRRAELLLPFTTPMQAAVPVVSEIAPDAPTQLGPVRFNELGRGQCRWIDGPTQLGRAHEAMACGADVDEPGCPWCAEHRRRARGKPTGSVEGLGTIDNWSVAARRVG